MRLLQVILAGRLRLHAPFELELLFRVTLQAAERATFCQGG